MSKQRQTLAGVDHPGLAHRIAGMRCGLVTNPTGVDWRLVSTANRVHAMSRLVALFGPEHGVRGDRQAGESITESRLDDELGVPCHSLYGGNTPLEQLLDGVDVLLYDIQDVGARFYTYIYTLGDCLEACARRGIPLLVLDRPNPLGGDIEGTLLREEFASGVGRYGLPVRYGMTPGEVARYLRQILTLDCELEVLPCQGWSRDQKYGQTALPWVMPSPNIPTPQTALAYIGTCLFEGTNLSEGRGTTHPFELIGAPFVPSNRLVAAMNAHALPGVLWRAAHFTPTFSKHAGELCHGVQLHITDETVFRPFETGIWLLEELRRQCPEMTCTAFLDNLFGDDALRVRREAIPQIIARGQRESAQFAQRVRPFLLY
ncbi:MAG: DUF1343 domain-containing protein [Victivallales bacterium]|nr:DUF1343 domain-containing protein [Victivallales bacterium]